MKTEPAEAYEAVKYYEAENINIDAFRAKKLCDVAFYEGQLSPNIKQLEWMVSEETETMLANIPFNNYYIIDGVEGMIFLTINIQQHIGRYATIEEAKAAAKADFEKRVMECLDL